ncbi:hypothetical protein CY34DRAFT_224379 [Suillus luteus UH-Slu-Lm8-n1]|uniref:Secreted protein n=1 Tax=Suillus luteus UH-Slu-Lm8-n1 TaxID=930992 RepID=A0A0D0BCK1_9AGAM|nr:hypothetical protein CY34DRAFT_224379 [Suillus luteus UH-Slu-Lm8-n1]
MCCQIWNLAIFLYVCVDPLSAIKYQSCETLFTYYQTVSSEADFSQALRKVCTLFLVCLPWRPFFNLLVSQSQARCSNMNPAGDRRLPISLARFTG